MLQWLPRILWLFLLATSYVNAKETSDSGWDINIEYKEARYYIHASYELKENCDKVWDVLTDYEHLDQFIPNLKISHIISGRNAEGITRVEQRLRETFLIFHKHLHTILEVKEIDGCRIEFNAVDGDIPYYNGSWEIQTTPAGCILHYQSESEPDTKLPRIFLNAVVRKSVRKNLTAVIEEVRRRSKTESP